MLLNFATLRANGVSLGSISGRVGGVLFPYVLDLKYQVGEGGEYLPMGIFGILAIGKSPYAKSEHFNPCDPIIDLFLFSHFKCGLRRTVADHTILY